MRHTGSSMSTPVPPPGPRCRRYELLLARVEQGGLLDDESPEIEALREHLEICAYCRTVLALYDVQAYSLRRNHSELIAGSPSFTADIIKRIQEEPIVSRLPENSTSEQPAAMPHLTTNNANDIARRRLDAARLALQPPKRPTPAMAAWLSPLAAVLLIAILAVAFFSAQHAGRSVATSLTSLPYAPGVGFEITAISMTSPSEGWAIVQSVSANQSPRLSPEMFLHDHNGTWSPVQLSSTTPLYDISMVSAVDGWAVGDHGLILHYNGHKWSPTASPTTSSLLSIRMLSATDGWASGDSPSGNDTPLILHYNGQQWETQSVPAVALAPPGWSSEMWSTATIQPEPDGEVWALTTWSPNLNEEFPLGSPPPNLSGTVILHYDGHQWQIQMSAPSVLLSSLSMDSAQDGWVIGINDFTGIKEPLDTNQAGSSATPVVGTSAQTVFYHYAQDHWERSLMQLPAISVSNPTPVTGKLAMVSPSDGWLLAATVTKRIVGSTVIPVASAYHFAQGHWLPATLPALTNPHGWSLVGVYFQKDGSGWIFGMTSKTMTAKGKASFVTWVPLLLHYSGRTWSIALD